MKSAPYRLITDNLLEKIRDGIFQPGALLPTERELTEMFGVSRGTVRRALSELIDAGWAEASPNRGTVAKQGPITPKSNLVGFVDHGSVLNRRLFFALNIALQNVGMHLIHVDSTLIGTEGALDRCVEDGLAAAVVWSKVGFPDVEHLESVSRVMPMIAVDHGLNGFAADVVSADHFGGAYLAVQHLIDIGCKRIAISGFFDNLDAHLDRFSGYLKALQDNGLDVHARNFLFTQTSTMTGDDTHLLSIRLNEPDRPDGIFITTDLCAPSVEKAILDAGLNIPNDVALASFGDDSVRSETVFPLSAVVVDWNGFAEETVALLLRRISNPRAEPLRIVLPVTFTPAVSESSSRAQHQSLLASSPSSR